MKPRLTTMLSVLFVFLLTFLFCGCNSNSSSVTRTISDSRIYTETEINDAIDFTEELFEYRTVNCILTEAVYDDSFQSEVYTDGHGEDYTIVIKAVYDIGDYSSNGELLSGHSGLEAYLTLTYKEGTWNYLITTENNNYKEGFLGTPYKEGSHDSIAE